MYKDRILTITNNNQFKLYSLNTDDTFSYKLSSYSLFGFGDTCLHTDQDSGLSIITGETVKLYTDSGS